MNAMYDHHDFVYHVYRATPKTTEIPMKECSAYGRIESGEREETHIYELPHAH